MRKRKDGEALPDNFCPYCRKRRVTRSGGGSCCGKPACLAKLNADSVGEGDRGKSAKGETVWVKGSRGHDYKVVSDKDVRGVPCFVLQDKKTGDRITRPIDDCEMR